MKWLNFEDIFAIQGGVGYNLHLHALGLQVAVSGRSGMDTPPSSFMTEGVRCFHSDSGISQNRTDDKIYPKNELDDFSAEDSW